MQALMTGLMFGESPRWHDQRLWFADWGTQEIIAVGLDGRSEVIVPMQLSSFQPISFDWLPDGRLIIVSLRQEAHRLRHRKGRTTLEPKGMGGPKRRRSRRYLHRR